MTVTIDLNVFLDVFLERGDFLAEATVLSLSDEKIIQGCIPSHGIPTLYYILCKTLRHSIAVEYITKILENMIILPVDKAILQKAFSLNFPDYEDAVVAVAAEISNSEYIGTNNLKDFQTSKVPAISPKQFLQIIEV